VSERASKPVVCVVVEDLRLADFEAEPNLADLPDMIVDVQAPELELCTPEEASHAAG
jgi:hypothetical protein